MSRRGWANIDPSDGLLTFDRAGSAACTRRPGLGYGRTQVNLQVFDPLAGMNDGLCLTLIGVGLSASEVSYLHRPVANPNART